MKYILKIVASILLLGSFAFAKFNHLSDNEVIKLAKQGIPVIDIRTPGEWRQTGIIKGAVPLMFFDANGRYDVNKWLKEFQKIVKDKNQPFILYCAHANRSKVVGNFLDKQLGYKNVNELNGGIIYGWIEKGRKTVPYKGHL